MPRTCCDRHIRECGGRLIYIDRLARFLDEQSRQGLAITADLDRLGRDMRALSPEDGLLVDAFVRGIRAFALAIALRYRALGGEVIYGASVQEIRVDRVAGRTTGVRLGATRAIRKSLP